MSTIEGFLPGGQKRTAELSNDAAGLTSPISSRFKSCRGYPSVNLLHVFSKYLPCEVRYVLEGPKQLL